MDLDHASEYVMERMTRELPNSLVYHDLAHTLDVVRTSLLLAGMEGLDLQSTHILHAAALFHDMGMIIRYDGHEELSAEIAGHDLIQFGFNPSEIHRVKEHILSTRLDKSPSTPGEKILCDADLDTLGRIDFFINSMKLRQEWAINGIAHYSLKEWLLYQIRFLEEHHYHTGSAKQLRQHQKEQNITDLKALFYH